MIRLSATGVTHTGLVRPDNQDSAFAGSDLVLVADGVGGAAAGEVASATTTYAVTATAMARRSDDPGAVLVEGVRTAQRQVGRGVAVDGRREGMATTLTAVFTNGVRAAIAHLGDSRAYLMRGDQMRRITRDHTFVADLVEQGQLTREEAVHHPWRNVVTRTVNGDLAAVADVTELALRPDDRLLLASDGLTDLVTDPVIERVWSENPDDETCEVLRDRALIAGGRDNVTVVVATVVEGPRVSTVGTLLGAVCDPHNIVDAAAVRPARSA